MKSIIRNMIYFSVALASTAAFAQSQRGTQTSYATAAPGATFVVQPSADAAVGRIFFIGSGQIACLDGQTGRVIWSEEGPGLSSQNIPGAGPVIAGSALVYMAGGGFFTAYGLDLQSGKRNWTLDKRSPALAAGPDALYLATQYGLGIVAVNAKSGKIKWERYANRTGGSVGKIVYAQGLLYTDTRNVWNSSNGKIARQLPMSSDALVTNKDYLFMTGNGLPIVAMNLGTGKVLWQRQNPLPASRDLPHDVYLAASYRYVVGAFYDNSSFEAHNGVVQVYSAANGQLLWSKNIVSDSGLWPDSVSVDDNLVYLVEPTGKDHKEGKLTAFKGDTGIRLWSRTIRAGIFGSVVPMGDTVFLSTGGKQGSGQNDTLYALKKRNGELLWTFTFKSSSTLPSYSLTASAPGSRNQ